MFDSIFSIIPLAFVCEFVDSALGMGYGTIMTPVLLMMGYGTLQIVPTVLLSELFTGLSAAFIHHRLGNVKFDFRDDKGESRIKKRLGVLGYIPRSRDAKIALVLGLCSTVGAVVAVFLALSLSKTAVKTYIGVLVSSMGAIILLHRKAAKVFSWGKITGLGVLAAFNKGISGGGYGPLVTSGQILSGVSSKASVGITSLAESFTCLVGLMVYLISGASIDWSIAPPVVFGAMLAVPFAGYGVKKTNIKKMTLLVGVATLTLGLCTLIININP